jgi:hypothetical protein
MEIAQHGSGDMPQPARDAMAFHGRPHVLGDDQPDARTRTFPIAPPPTVDDEIGLRHPDAALQRGVKLR